MTLKNKSRSYNTILNSFAGIMSYIFVMVATLVARIAFARFLGSELLGLNSLYTSVLQILQISELGISNAIIVFLYAPVKNQNREKVKSLMNLYKKVYLLFSLCLFCLGILVDLLVIPNIVSVNTIKMNDVQLYFILFLIGIVCSYLFAHNKSIIYAEQKNSFISWVNAIQKIIVCVFQLFAIFWLKSYYLYLVIIIIGNLIENLICHFWVMKRHPYLAEKKLIDLVMKKKKV